MVTFTVTYWRPRRGCVTRSVTPSSYMRLARVLKWTL